MTLPTPKQPRRDTWTCASCALVARYDNQLPNKDGLCVACAPIASKCSHGMPCEFDRIVWWDRSNTTIPFLRLCELHAAERAERLAPPPTEPQSSPSAEPTP